MIDRDIKKYMNKFIKEINKGELINKLYNRAFY